MLNLMLACSSKANWVLIFQFCMYKCTYLCSQTLYLYGICHKRNLRSRTPAPTGAPSQSTPL